MNSETEFDLKYLKIEATNLLRGDIIYYKGKLWQCASKNMLLFIDLDTREQQ